MNYEFYEDALLQPSVVDSFETCAHFTFSALTSPPLYIVSSEHALLV